MDYSDRGKLKEDYERVMSGLSEITRRVIEEHYSDKGPHPHYTIVMIGVKGDDKKIIKEYHSLDDKVE